MKGLKAQLLSEARVEELEGMIQNNRIVIRNTQRKIDMKTSEVTKYPNDYPRLPVSLVEEKLSSDVYKLWMNLDRFIYDDDTSECPECDLHPSTKFLNLGTYLGLIDPELAQRRGRGAFLGLDGSLYEGYWLAGNMNGKGRIIYKNGSMYDGYWKDNKYLGNGPVIDISGEGKFIGKWMNGKAAGMGTMEFNDGTHYEGLWSKGEITGHGVFTLKDGSKRVGNWANNGSDGLGKIDLTKLNGDKYKGGWLNNQREGLGSWTTATEEYVGQWAADKKSGKGVLTTQG